MAFDDGAGFAGEQENAAEDFASRLSTFLSAIGAISTEEERARLIATRLSAVVPCAVSGVALVDESRTWTISWQMKGEPLEVGSELIEQLEPLDALAAARATLLIATREGGPAALSVPPVFEALRVRRLAVGRLSSSHHHLGLLFAGREAGRPFSIGRAAGAAGDRAAGGGLYREPAPQRGADTTVAAHELMRVVERAVLTAVEGRLRFDVPGRAGDTVRQQTPVSRAVLTDAELQRAHDNNLRAALEQTRWKIYGPGGTAELLGIKPTTLTARIKKAGLRRPDR